MLNLFLCISDSIYMSSAAIALSEEVTACVGEALVVGGGAKRGRSRRILTSVLCVVVGVFTH
jgi:hypothetical protein